MNATIEPRLIALLNSDDHSEPYTPTSLELPPLHDPNILRASGRPLLLEPDASKRNGKPTPNSQLTAKHKALISQIDDEETHKGNDGTQTAGKAPTERALGGSSPQSLRKILDVDTEGATAVSSKKRNIVETNKDDFVQLPQPPKKQKAAKQVVPPIIIGLFEPPPQAALFPPIASSSFHDSHGRNSLNIVPPKDEEPKRDNSNSVVPKDIEEKALPVKVKKSKDVKVRKKWSEDETNNLLLGVHKHGVGNWTDILEDPDFFFNGRSGADLKDRFRTCCPAELRGKASNSISSHERSEKVVRKEAQPKSKSSLMSENILIADVEVVVKSNGQDIDSNRPPKKSRAHRKRLEDLVQLGIEGPFRKSQRRERRPFTAEEDRQILEGYNIHGPLWTKIQRDFRFQLHSRQPTDLRDRFRNKYPERFRSEEKGGMEISMASRTQSSSSLQSLNGRGKENVMPNPGSMSSNVYSCGQEGDSRFSDTFGKESAMPPQLPSFQNFSNREGLRIQEIISTDQDSSRTLPHHNSLFSFRDNFSSFSDQPESNDGLPFPQFTDWNQGITAPFSSNINEMDISRLLLDETWPDLPSHNGKEKENLAEISSTVTSSAEPLHNGPSFFNMLNNSDQIVDMNDTAFG